MVVRPKLYCIFQVGLDQTIVQWKYFICILEWEVSLNEAQYSVHFIWCLNALLWDLKVWCDIDTQGLDALNAFEFHSMHFIIELFLFPTWRTWHLPSVRPSWNFMEILEWKCERVRGGAWKEVWERERVLIRRVFALFTQLSKFLGLKRSLCLDRLKPI